MSDEVLPVRPFDAKLLALRAEGCSMQEISDRLNGVISPAAAGARIKDLYKMKDWLTASELDMENMLEFRRILATLKGRYEDNDNLKLQVNVLDKIAGRLDKRAAATTTDLNTLYDNQGKIMAHAFALALDHMKQEFGHLIDAEVWDETARDGLLVARAELDKHEAIEA